MTSKLHKVNLTIKTLIFQIREPRHESETNLREWTEKRRAHRRSNDDGFIRGAAGVGTGEAVVLIGRGEGRFRDEGKVALERREGRGAGSPPRLRSEAVGNSGGAGHEEAGKGAEVGPAELGGNWRETGEGSEGRGEWCRVLERENVGFRERKREGKRVCKKREGVKGA